MGAESVMNFVLEKLKELLLLIESFGGYLIDEVDKVFPPETRASKLHHWLHVAAPFLIIGAVLLLCFCCYCRRGCCYCRRGWRCCCCCGGGRRVKMMKAPGRDYMMPRHVFERDPRSYFRGLHASQIEQLV